MKLQKCELDLHLDALERVGRGLLEDRDKDVDSDDDIENSDAAPPAVAAPAAATATTSYLQTSVSSIDEQQVTATGECNAVVQQLAKDLQVLTFSNPLAEGDNSKRTGDAVVKPLVSPNNNTGVASELVSDTSSDSESDSSSDSDSSSSESSTSSSSSDSDDDESSSALDSDDDECLPEQPSLPSPPSS